MTEKIKIVSRYNSDTVLFECDAPEGMESGLYMRHALEKAVEARAYLIGANLRDAYLIGANLRDANLRDAYLIGANLRGANLIGANLIGANLIGANLIGANLRDANLRDAYLSDAYLIGANLSGAYLIGAKNLAEARGIDTFRTDFWDVLLRAPAEIAGVRAALVEGRVDGSTYSGECACLVGTIGNVRQVDYTQLGNGIKPDSGRPAEQWFMSIGKGDTPETNQCSALAVQWLDELTGLLQLAKAVQS